jgi:cytochrome P450
MEASFIPFGYGARLCLGKAFATLEIKLFIACLFLRYSTSIDESVTTEESMQQSGTHDALPKELRCQLILSPLEDRF